MTLSKPRLINRAIPDGYVNELKGSNPRLYTALKNLGDGNKDLTNAVFPRLPVESYRGRIIIPGVLSTYVPQTDILSHRYHVVLPIDPSNYWVAKNVKLVTCFITAKTIPVSSSLSIDILVSQKRGTTVFKSLFKPNHNPILPVGELFTENVDFAIDTLYQDDLGRVDILSVDSVTADVELVLLGYMTFSEVLHG